MAMAFMFTILMMGVSCLKKQKRRVVANDLNNNPRNFTLQLLEEDDFTKKITGEMLQQVILKSPVDTGAYRNNHRVGIGNIDNSYDVNDTGNNAESIGVAKIRAGGGLGKIVHVSNSALCTCFRKWAFKTSRAWYLCHII